jgi:hypothetical protein
MKKNIIIILVALSVIVPLSSCNDWLEEHPKAVAVDTFYNTKDEADAAIAAISNRFRAIIGGSQYTAMLECFADYNYGRGTWSANSTYELLNTTNKGRTDGLWTNLYRTVRDANIVISRMPSASSLSEEQKSAYVAEARFYRAFAYFDLVRWWNNVPLRTEENMEEFDMPLTPAEQIWTFVISDLEYAVANCPDSPVVLGRPYKNAARTLLADVYMTRKNFTAAKPLLEAVISSNAYSLVSVSTVRDFDKIFGYEVTNTTEEIFYQKTSRTNNSGWELVMFNAHPNAIVNGGKMQGTGGWYALVLSSENKWIEGWDSNDLRKDFNYLPFSRMDTFDGLPMDGLSVKFYDPDAESSGGATCDNPVYRYADVLMMYAEVLNEVNNGPNAEAMEYLNMIHRRGYGYDPTSPSPVDLKLSDYSTKQAFMDILTKEQCYEFWTEGKRWPFLVRTGQAEKYVKEYKGRDINPDLYHFPIPDTEFTYNTALNPSTDQNPGY